VVGASRSDVGCCGAESIVFNQQWRSDDNPATVLNWIPTGEQSLLQTHIAATVSVWLCVRMKNCRLLWNSTRRSALVANWLDKLAGFFAKICKTDLNPGEGASPDNFSRSFRPAVAE